jgi:hypothetical protein
VDAASRAGVRLAAVAASTPERSREASTTLGADRVVTDSAPHLRHIQLGDTNRLEPGTGHLDWNAMLGALDDMGYHEWMAMECGMSGLPTQVLLAVSALLKRGASGNTGTT